MSFELEKRALEIFARAQELAPERREAFLRAEAAGSDELLELLLSMLRVESPSEALARSMGAMTLVTALRLEGRTLGDYRLEREIGGGAVGRIFVAQQISLGRRVAVKVLRLEHAQNPEMLRRFEQEPEDQAALRHPNIVKVLGRGLADGWHFFAMEYVDGTSLAKLLESYARGEHATEPSPIDLGSPQACAELVEKVALALHHAHVHGLVHRDVKPHNILVDRRGEPYVTDFGLALNLDRTALTASLGDGLRGTLAYMSPEQAMEFHAVDARADIYSLGAVLYQMLTRSLPFEAESGVLLLSKILSPNRHVRPPHHFLPDFDPALSGICTTALEKQPGKRFASALEMAEHLRAFREGEPRAPRPVPRFKQYGERRIDRRVVLAGMAVGVPVAGALALGVREWMLPPRHASLRIHLPDGPGDARVRVLPFLSPDSRLGSPVRDELRGSGETIRGIQPGPYRIVVQRGDAFAELHRTLVGTSRIEAMARPTPADPGDDSMARVAAGGARLDLPMLGERELVCPDFWIDRSPVSNAQFKRFLEDTGRAPSDVWQGRWLELWSGPSARRADWDELPVVKVSWTLAREYAEWMGKRLPTPVEWWLALGFGTGPSIPDETVREIERRFALDRPEFVASSPDSKSPSTAAAYLEHAAPARSSEEHAFGPHGLWHPFGQITQWLEPGPFQVTDSGDPVASGLRFEAVGAWHSDPRVEGIIGLGIEESASGDTGFRCAKTAEWPG